MKKKIIAWLETLIRFLRQDQKNLNSNLATLAQKIESVGDLEILNPQSPKCLKGIFF